jgi:hypothetical protein
VPFSLAKMKALPPLTPFWVTWKVAPLLKTMPVGLEAPALPGGIATTRDCGTPFPSYSVELALPLFATQTKPAGLKAMPQALISFGSVCSAPEPLSATSARVTKLLASVGVDACGGVELIGMSSPPPQEMRRAAAIRQAASLDGMWHGDSCQG